MVPKAQASLPRTEEATESGSGGLGRDAEAGPGRVGSSIRGPPRRPSSTRLRAGVGARGVGEAGGGRERSGAADHRRLGAAFPGVCSQTPTLALAAPRPRLPVVGGVLV